MPFEISYGNVGIGNTTGTSVFISTPVDPTPDPITWSGPRSFSRYLDSWQDWFKLGLKSPRIPGQGGYYPRGSEFDDNKEYYHVRYNLYGTDEVFDEGYAVATQAAKELGLPIFPKDNCILRVLHYFDTPVGKEHVDFDMLTVAFPASKPGLQIWDEDEGCFIGAEPGGTEREVLVGEMAEIFTGGRLKATRHRIKGTPGERMACVFFYHPPKDFVLQPGYTAGNYLKEEGI